MLVCRSAAVNRISAMVAHSLVSKRKMKMQEEKESLGPRLKISIIGLMSFYIFYPISLDLFGLWCDG
jgi:hypothetical protein